MKSRLLCLSLLLAFASLSAKQPTDSGQKVMLSDLEGIRNVFATRYAPAEWKAQLFGWRLDNTFDKAQRRILAEKPRTVKAFQQILKALFLSPRDYHTRILFYSTERAYFPLALKGSS